MTARPVARPAAPPAAGARFGDAQDVIHVAAAARAMNVTSLLNRVARNNVEGKTIQAATPMSAAVIPNVRRAVS